MTNQSRRHRVLFAALFYSMTVAAWGGIPPEQIVDDAELTKNGKLPVPLSQPVIEYPFDMSRSGLIGTVLLEFIIDTKGEVRHVEVLESSNPWFERPALAGIVKWKFRPGEIAGRAVNVRARQKIDFKMNMGFSPAFWNVKKGRNHDQLRPEFRWDTPPRPLKTAYPVYPFEQLRAGRAGKVRISFVVDPAGSVVAAKVNEATEPEFGAAVLAMIAAWQFDPPRNKDGSPCYATLASEYDFKPSGLGAVPLTDGAREILRDLARHPERITTPQDLDGPLRPLHRRAPIFPRALFEAGKIGEVLLEFFVDRNGDAQLPRIVKASAPEFGSAAAQAVATWRFEPPMKEGKPVVTRIQIPLEFTLGQTKKETAN